MSLTDLQDRASTNQPLTKDMVTMDETSEAKHHYDDSNQPHPQEDVDKYYESQIYLRHVNLINNGLTDKELKYLVEGITEIQELAKDGLAKDTIYMYSALGKFVVEMKKRGKANKKADKKGRGQGDAADD